VPLLQPFFFLYFLHVIAPPELFPLQVAGAMLFSTQNIGSWCLSDSAVFRIELRLQDIFVASPVDKVRYLFGIAFSNLIPAMPAIVVLGIILSMVTAVSLFGWIVLIACILTIWILYSAIGIAVSSRLRSQREVWPVGNLIFTLLGILSPLYYPISRLPSGWGEIARLLPATYAALLVQGALGLERSTNFAVDGGFDRHGRIPEGLVLLSTTEPVEHHLDRQDHRNRIDFVAAGVLRGAAVNRLEHRVCVPDVPPRRHAHPALEDGGQVRRNVP